ncbi:hypothetical protein G6F37_008373 [Rhizopus arrhizus]|nr:hypothetical protein G6F38_010159 [Rhizopus arrhizus]KAG1155624.1 hypothetical protein G6F37_008373 [Rhizopus arrhizus]
MLSFFEWDRPRKHSRTKQPDTSAAVTLLIDSQPVSILTTWPPFHTKPVKSSLAPGDALQASWIKPACEDPKERWDWTLLTLPGSVVMFKERK